MGDFEKFPEKIFKMRFLNTVTEPKNVKGWPLRFFDIHCVAKYRNKRKGDPLVESEIISKKVAQYRKKSE